MKTHFLFVILTMIIACTRAEASNDTAIVQSGDTLIVVCIKAEALKDSVLVQPTCLFKDTSRIVSSNSQPDDISALTFAVNSANNVLTGETILVGILTLFVAFLSIFEYYRFKRKVDEALNEAEILKKKNETIEKTQTLNNQYLQKINQWIFANAYAIANSPTGSSNHGRNQMEKSMLNYYLMKLYLSTDKHEIDGCINYIKTKGGIKEIEHLQFIVDNDLIKYKRDKASEAIGYIRRGK